MPTASLALSDVYWSNPEGGSFIEPTNWNGGELPVGGTNKGTLDLNTGYTVTFPDHGTASFSPQFKTPYNAAGATDLKKLVLDFKGSFEWTDAESEIYEGEPFKFYTGNGHFFNWEGWPGKQYGPAAVTNALVSLWVDEESGMQMARMRIGRGVFNMARNGTLVVGHAMPGGIANGMDVVFEDNAAAWFYNANLRMQGADTRFAVTDGAKVKVANDLNYPQNTDGNYKSVLEVSGEGSELYGGNFCLFSVSSVQRDVSVVVTNKGLLQVGEMRQNNPGHVKMLVSDEGVFRLRTTGGNFMKQADSTIDLCVTNNGVLEIVGNGRWGWNEWNDTCKVNLHTAGGTVRLPSGNNFNWNRDWIVEEGTDIVIDGNLYLSTSVTNNDLGITVDFSASGASGSGSLLPGNEKPCKLVITNNVVDVHYVKAANQAAAATEILVGGTGRLRTDGLDIGILGTATLNIRDEGVADVGYCRIGYGTANTDREVVVNIEGGRLVCTNSQINVCDAQRICRINLTGGELYSRQTLGWNNAHYHNPGGYGYAYFVGNGGTLKAPTSNNDYFFGAFDDAKVGAKGLTVDSDYTVGIRQTFADLAADSGSGKIVFIGAGTKRILATAWNGYTPGTSTHSYTVVAGGTLLFETGADWQTHLVVTNGATASTVGGCTGLTLKGLTLGDADTVGTLAVDPADVIVVDGPVSLPNGSLSFSANMTNGTYGILKVKDPETNFPAAAREAWARMLLSAGRSSGHSYMFETSVDETTGDMTLSVVVDDVKDITGDAVWTGANGTTWSDGANWESAAKPGVLDAAVFSSETAPASVAIGSGELIGAVEFSAEQSYAISGSGSLAFSDSGNASITVTKGSHEISARLDNSFPLPVVTAEGAKVTVSGAMKPAGLVKSGDGNLTLTQNKVDALTLSDGVVTFAGSGEKTVSSLSLGAASKNRQVGIKTDVATTVKEFSPTAGLVVKAGGQPLVIESSQRINFAPAEGPSGNYAYTTDYTFSETGGVTQAGAAVVVTEGNLTLRGTGASPADVMFATVHNVMVGVRNKDCSEDPSFTLDGARLHADKHTRIGAAYDKDGAGWQTASITIDNGSYARFDTMHIGGDIGNVDLDNPPHVYITVDHASRISAWYSFNINNSGRSDRLPKMLVNMLVDHGSELVDYTGNNGVLIKAPGVDLKFDNGSVFGRQTADWSAAVNPGRITFGADSFDDHVRFYNGSRFLCSNLLYNATADWATNNLHFADGEWFAGDADFDFVFKNGHRIAVHAEGAGLKLNPPENRAWTMHTILTGTDVVKGGDGTLVFDVAKYLNNSTDVSSLTVNARQSATLAITGKLDVKAGQVEIADGAAVSGDCALAVASGATVDLGGNAVSFTALSGAGTVTNGTLSTTLAYGDGTVLPTLNGVDGTLTVDFGRTAENPLDMAAAKAGIVVAHYTGDAPVNLKVRAVNTGIARARTTVACEDGDVVAKISQVGFSVIIR
ncbi:MAG: hypothetical protein IKC14_01075 [Kiritimatiellae bacterium]|nr:hypothetical protein [Kiritimatiellia bacterium]